MKINENNFDIFLEKFNKLDLNSQTEILSKYFCGKINMEIDINTNQHEIINRLKRENELKNKGCSDKEIKIILKEEDRIKREIEKRQYNYYLLNDKLDSLDIFGRTKIINQMLSVILNENEYKEVRDFYSFRMLSFECNYIFDYFENGVHENMISVINEYIIK